MNPAAHDPARTGQLGPQVAGLTRGATTRFLRLVAALSLIVAVQSLQTERAHASEVWPLVKDAEGAVWGRLASIQEGAEDRLLTIVVHEFADGRVSGGPGVLRILERAGQLPDGTRLLPGSTGLFLFHSPRAQSRDFLVVDGWLVAGGFFLMSPEPEAKEQLTTLIAATIRGDAADLPWRSIDALLHSETPECRRTFLRWLVENPNPVPSELQAELARTFVTEREPDSQSQFLEIFLLKELPLAPHGVSRLIIGSEDPETNELARQYLRHHGSNEEFAELLIAFPGAEPGTRLRLLDAYSALGLEEARPWFFEALLSDDPDQVIRALQVLPASGLSDLEDTYEQLLESESALVQALALEGLGTIASPRAGRILRHFMESTERDPRLRSHAHRIIEHPYRHGRVRSRNSR